MYAIYAHSTDPAYNLALEETLYESLCPGHPGIFLIWRNAPSIIVGCHQNTVEEINQQYCLQHNISVVRRQTGGGAVFHDLGNINFSFLNWVEKNRLGGFDEYMRPMVQALIDLGIPAEYTSRNDITVNGRKVAGTAQRQTGQKMLHHGCVLVDVDFSHLSGALAADPEKFQSKGVASHRARVANLKEFLPPANDSEEQIRMVIDAMRARCAEEEKGIDSSCLASAEQLAEKKYRAWEWNWGKSPRYTEKRRKRFAWGRIELFLDVRHGIIHSCRIYGDFFARRDIGSLEQGITGHQADAASLRRALSRVPVASWFIGAEDRDLRDFICGDGA